MPAKNLTEVQDSEFDRALAMDRLGTFVREASPGYEDPRHLAPLLERFERALEGEPQRICCHAPPRHGKTEAVLHVPAFALRKDPTRRVAYIAYGDRIARSKSLRARQIAESIGIPLTRSSMNEWSTEQGGGLLAGGVGGPLTGFGVNLMIVDDPIKNRIEAESATYRDRLMDWWRDVARTRIEPGGSAFVFMTRWHQDDLIGRLVGEGFEYIKLPAIDDEGEALWPGRWSLESLRALKQDVGPYTWASLFQGEPRPRGGSVFDGAHTYRVAPNEGRTAYGLDLSYSAKTKSDHSVAVQMVRSGDKFYVTSMRRQQVNAPQFKTTCVALHKQKQGSWRWYASGTEIGSADFFKQGDGIPLRAMPARGDKFTRALKYSAAWAAGKILIPESAPWAEAFLAEHLSFTGLDDKHDDIIDAAVAAFDELSSSSDANIRSKPLTPRVRGLASMEI